MTKKIISLYFLFLSFISLGQINQYGYPFYTYYDSKDYNAYDQFWDIVEDENGLIYAANNSDGILQFDGVTWRKIQIEGNPEVRNLAIDKEGIIYVGCSGDFGYLKPTTNGKLEYVSLNNKFLSDSIKYSYIFKVNIIEDSIFYSSDNFLLFKYDVNADTVLVSNLPQFSLFTFAINNCLYGSSYLDGLYELKGGQSRGVKNGDFYKTKNIFSILQDSNSLKIITGKQGFFNYNINTGESIQLLNEGALEYMKSYVSYSAVSLNESNLLGTIGSGIVVSANGEIKEVFDEQIGLKDHICASVKKCRNSVWGALSIGLVRYEQNSPFRKFAKESNIEGFIVGITEFEGKLLVATEIGLFSLDERMNEPSYFNEMSGINGQTTFICKMKTQADDESILIATTDGIYKLSGLDKPIELIEESLIGIEKLWDVDLKAENDKSYNIDAKTLMQEQNSNRLWVGSKLRLFCLELIGDVWHVTDDIYNIGVQIVNLAQDKNKNIWASTSSKGLLKFDVSTQEFSEFNTKSGLPTNHELRVYEYQGNLFCTTPNGLYLYKESENIFVQDTCILNEFDTFDLRIRKFEQDTDGNIYLVYANNSSKGISKLEFSNTSKEFNLTNHFKRLGENVEFDGFYEYKNAIWFGVSDVLYSYNKNTKFDYTLPYKCLVRKVEGLDSTYFFGAFYEETEKGLVPSNIQNENQKPILKYAQNDITFHFAAPYFEGTEALKYSYKLVGFKTEWSKWNKEPKAVFTNLNEGIYKFQVKAKNIYDIESEIGQYEFSILPPWYRTMVAFFIYFVGFIFLMWVILKLYTRRLLQEKIRLEGIVQERTAEIREQRDEITEQKQSIEASIQYASRIQRAILPSVDLAEEILPEHFILFRPRDIVSGDYYWMNNIDNKTVLVAADCTGHGVPGAFMSMLGVSFLNAIVIQEKVDEPHLILNKLRDRVKKTLKQEGKEGEAKDGMDVAIVVIDDNKKKLYFAGAYNPVLIYRKDELHEIKADRMPIGIYIREKESFTLHEFDYQTGDTFYIFSDGYPDQFGGEKGQKFRIKAMKQLLADIQEKPMAEQKEILNQTIEDWMGTDNDQIDDMVIVGVRL